MAKRRSTPSNSQAPSVGSDLAEEGPGEFELTAAHEAIDAENLAGAHRKRNIAIGIGMRQVARFEDDGRVGSAVQHNLAEIAVAKLGMALADHLFDYPGLGYRRRNRGGDHPRAVAEDGDDVGNPQNILEEMRNEYDAAPAFLQPLEDGKQPLDLGR